MVNEVIYSDLEDSGVKLGEKEMETVVYSNEVEKLMS